MPRRLGRFQKAFVGWHDANRARFLVPIRLKMFKTGSVLIRFMNHPECLQITARPSNLGVWVVWQGVIWASRTLNSPELPYLLNFGIDEPCSVIGPQGWLFHDLTEHAYGADQPQVKPAELLQVGEVHVDVVIRHSVQINLTSL